MDGQSRTWDHQLARALRRELEAAVAQWPAREQMSIGAQLLRSVGSIGANIAEAMGRWYFADRRRLLYIAQGSLTDTEHWIDVAQERGLLPPDAHKHVPEIVRTLNGPIRLRARR